MPVSLHPLQVGRGWRELDIAEPLTTFTQAYLPHTETWVDATYLTRDGYKNVGRLNYRVPVSLRAWISAFFTALPKLGRRYVLRKRW